MPGPGVIAGMLSLHVHAADLRHPTWSWRADRWVNGASWVKPLAHPALEHLKVEGHEGMTYLVVRERLAGTGLDAASDTNGDPAGVAGLLSWPADATVIRSGGGRLHVHAGPFGTAALYLVSRTGTLSGSWDLTELRPFLSVDRLSPRGVVRLLSRQHRYSSDTCFADVHRLTERATGTFDGTSLTIAYPPPAEHILRARKPRAGVDVVEAFSDLLARTVAARQLDGFPVGAELSGGADSANVAVTLARSLDRPVRTFGLIVSGAMGECQHARRDALVQRIGARDTAIEANRHLPFSSTGARPPRPAPHPPGTAYYSEAFGALTGAATRQGVRVLCTGFGGDEITALHPSEATDAPPATPPTPSWLGPTSRAALDDVDHNLAPVPPVPVTALMAFGVHNPPYLQAGIWPVAPLADPHVVRFAEQLPQGWRRNKTLLRTRLQRAGFDRSVTHPAQPEDFSGLMQGGLRRFGLGLLRRLMADSVLADAGYIDPVALADALSTAERAERLPSTLADPLSLELALRSLA